MYSSETSSQENLFDEKALIKVIIVEYKSEYSLKNMEPIIVVSGKQSTLPQKNKILWIDYLIFMNTLFYLYTLVMNDYSRTSDFVIFSIFYGLIGLYLPLYGRKCLEENKSTNVFTTCQGVLSAYHFLIHCGNIAVFYTFNNLCSFNQYFFLKL